jgi:hypothetical protein
MASVTTAHARDHRLRASLGAALAAWAAACAAAPPIRIAEGVGARRLETVRLEGRTHVEPEGAHGPATLVVSVWARNMAPDTTWVRADWCGLTVRLYRTERDGSPAWAHAGPPVCPAMGVRLELPPGGAPARLYEERVPMSSLLWAALPDGLYALRGLAYVRVDTARAARPAPGDTLEVPAGLLRVDY